MPATHIPKFDGDAVRQGATIREMRNMRGLTQDELANAALISRPYLANIEAGRKAASSRAIVRIADALAVPQISIIRPADPLDDGPRDGAAA